MCEQEGDFHLHTLEYVLDYYLTQEMFEKAPDTYQSALMHVSKQLKNSKRCLKNLLLHVLLF